MTGNVFISYASADQQTADKLVAEIERRGIRCWISSRDIRAGEEYQGAIVAALEASAVVLLLFSRHAIASAEIPRELGLASRFKKTVIPARLEDIVPSGSFAYQMTTAQFIDLFRDFEAKVDDLCIRLAELLQSSAEVQKRIAREQRRNALTRKLKRFAIGSLTLLVLAATVWALRTRIEGLLAGGTTPASPTAQAPPPPSVAQNNPPQPVAPPGPAAAAPANPAVAALPVAPAASPPVSIAATAPAQLPKGVLASRTYEGIRFDVMSANADGRGLQVLVTATNTQPRKVKLKAFTPPDPMAIDIRGNAGGWPNVSGIPICSNDVKNCSKPDPTNWSDAYQGVPLDILLKFSSRQEFIGSNVSVSFNVLVGIETGDGEPLQTTLIPVVFTSLPLKPGATIPPALASRTYEGIRFDVTSANADGKDLDVLVTATNTQPRKVKLKAFTPPDPTAVDNWGNAGGWPNVSGIPICSNDVRNCSKPDPTNWSDAYQDGPLDILLKFSSRQEFSAPNLSISFNVLLGVETADGEPFQTTLVPVAFTNLPLKPGATIPQALASQTYEGIRFDVISANADGKNLNVLVIATNTQPRKVKLKAFTPPDPTAIDNRGNAGGWPNVSGIPICSNDVKNCSKPDPNNWANAYRDDPLDILLQFSSRQEFISSNVSVSFNVLLGVETADGESLNTKLIPVSFPGLTLKLRNL